jgi:hypothetical protein
VAVFVSLAGGSGEVNERIGEVRQPLQSPIGDRGRPKKMHAGTECNPGAEPQSGLHLLVWVRLLTAETSSLKPGT